MRRRLLISLVAAAALGATAPRLAAQEATVQLDAARGELRQTYVERARDRLQRAVAEFPNAAPEVLGEVHFLLGLSHLALRQLDSVAPHFQAAVALEPFRTVDGASYNPDVVSAFDRARREAVALGIRVPPDTTLSPREGSLPLSVAIGRPGSVSLTIAQGDGPSRVIDEVDATRGFQVPISLMGPDRPLDPGVYRVTGRFRSPRGDTATATIALTVARLPVDTTAHVAPLDPSGFRPEATKGGLPIRSLLAGAAVGAATAVLPMVLWNGDLGSAEARPGALVVGLAVTVSGVVGMVTGRPDVPIAENIAYNQSQRQQWTERNQAIAQQNEEARRFAPLRITSGERR